jgi:hypothetical protein
MYPSSPHLFGDLEHRIRQRTGWRVRDFTIEVLAEPDRAVLRGQATTCIARQIAENLVHDYFPHVVVENTIGVDSEIDFLPGMPLN